MLNTKPCGLEKVTATFSILGHFTTYCNHFGYLRRIFGLKVFIDQGELRFSSNGGWCWEDHSPFHVCSNHVCPRTFSVVSPAATFASFKFSWYVVQINPLQETHIPLPPSRALFQDDDDFSKFPWHVFQGEGIWTVHSQQSRPWSKDTGRPGWRSNCDRSLWGRRAHEDLQVAYPPPWNLRWILSK